MGIFRSILGFTKARATQRILRRTVGGPLSTALIAAWLGKKAYDAYQERRRTRYMATSVY